MLNRHGRGHRVCRPAPSATGRRQRQRRGFFLSALPGSGAVRLGADRSVRRERFNGGLDGRNTGGRRPNVRSAKEASAGRADGRDASGPALSSSSPILRHKPLDTDLVMHHCDASQRRPRVFAGRGERSDDPICIAGCTRASSRPASRASYAGRRHERGTRCRAFADASARRDRPRRDRSSGRSGDHVGKEARTACPCLKRGM